MERSDSFIDDLAAWADKQRARLGEPPTAEQLIALRDGELSEKEAERLRDRLAVDPEWADIYLELKRGAELEADGTRTVDSDAVVDAAVVDDAWNRLSMELDRGSAAGQAAAPVTARVIPFRRSRSAQIVLGLAAMLIFALGLAWFWDRPQPLPDGDYHEVKFTGDRYRGQRLAIPREAIGIAFLVDTRKLTPHRRVVAELLDISDVSSAPVREESIVIRAEMSEIRFQVSSNSLEEKMGYRLIVRPPDSSIALVQEDFTLVFTD